jgi:SAM domain (Sterile alpha motif)
MEPPMQRIADWLEKLGMPEYAQRFAQNGINVEVLCYLADQDLKDIGVLPGHRRIMRATMGELAGPVTTPPSSRPTNGVRWRCAEQCPSVSATVIKVSQSLSRERILEKLTGSWRRH